MLKFEFNKLHVLIGCLYFLLKITNGESRVMSNQTRNAKEATFIDVKIATDIDKPLLPEKSSGICMPFYSCSANKDRTAWVILSAVTIFGVCFYYQYREYCDVKKTLDNDGLYTSGQCSQRRNLQ